MKLKPLRRVTAARNAAYSRQKSGNDDEFCQVAQQQQQAARAAVNEQPLQQQQRAGTADEHVLHPALAFFKAANSPQLAQQGKSAATAVAANSWQLEHRQQVRHLGHQQQHLWQHQQHPQPILATGLTSRPNATSQVWHLLAQNNINRSKAEVSLQSSALPVRPQPVKGVWPSIQKEPLDLSAKAARKEPEKEPANRGSTSISGAKKIICLETLQRERPKVTITAGRKPGEPMVRPTSPVPDVTVSVWRPGSPRLVFYSVRPTELSQSLKWRYPFLRATTEGAVVLWSFLWALVRDPTYCHVARWISSAELEFIILDTAELTNLWAAVKDVSSASWESLKKVLSIYLLKGVLAGELEKCQFRFRVVPKE